MSEIDRLIHEFTDANADRCWIVSQLEESGDQRVLSLFLRTLADFKEEDVLRIEIMKSFVMRDDPAPNHTRIANTVVDVVTNDPDELVRQHAANALKGYTDVDGVLAVLESLVKNESEDIDVRHNALAAISTNAANEGCRAALLRLASVSELGRYAQRRLNGE
ncbi:hypothetical protein AB1K70_17605 [Bremerella sp. JC770]|uniref:hypothetical protein n=1 Tax=Bremerella sp. JC770 TaxID=3232137 RepID=UPI00345B281B